MAGTTTVVGPNGEVTTRPTGTACFEVKLPSSVQYGSNLAAVYLPFEMADSPHETAENARETIAEAKKIVLEALGVEYELTYDEGIERVTALLEKHFGPGVKVEERQTAPQSSSGGHKVKILKPMDDTVPEWLDAAWQALVDKGDIEASENEVWDNRKFLPEFGGQGNPKAPWFRTSKTKKAIWPPKGSKR